MPASLQKSIAADILIKITEEFCDFCEKSNDLKLEKKIFHLSKLLSDLQAAIYKIQSDDIDTFPEVETYKQSPSLSENFLDFGIFEDYTLTLEPFALTKKGFSTSGIGVGSLKDDISDIYQDLKRALHFYHHPSGSTSETIWDLCFHYNTHWGYHLVNAQRILFEALQDLGIILPISKNSFSS